MHTSHRTALLVAVSLSALVASAACKPKVKPAPDPHSPWVGVWSTADNQGNLLNVVIYPNGRATAVYTDGPSGAQGEQGTWTADGAKTITISYTTGWTDVIQSAGDVYSKSGFAPGIKTTDFPSNQAAATRVVGPMTPFVGVWNVTGPASQPADGTFTKYVALKSDGSARVSCAPEATGTWQVAEGMAVILMSDGWADLIRSTDRGYRHEGWAPGADRKGPPTVNGVASAVGASGTP